MKRVKQKRPSPKTLKKVFDQLGKWAQPNITVRVSISQRARVLNMIGHLHRATIGEQDSFDFISLSGDIWVPLLPEIHETAGVEMIGADRTVLLHDAAGSLSIREFELKARVLPEPNPEAIEKVNRQLATWAAAKTPVTMAAYTRFSVFSIEGNLHKQMTDAVFPFNFTALNNVFRASVAPALAASVTVRTMDSGQTAVFIEGEGSRILLAEPRDQNTLAELLKASGGRVN
jgi:hypothetical protein